MDLIENLSIKKLEDFLFEPRSWDVFITCGSFEERCKRSAYILEKKNANIGISLIFNYKETDPKNIKEENIKKMKIALLNVSKNVHIFDTESVSEPAEGMKNFLNFLSNSNINFEKKNIIVDITVFTKPYFFLLFKILNKKINLNNFYIIYTEPEKYKSVNPNTREIILTQGLDRIESMPGFFGSSIYPKNALIVIMGFEGKRAEQVFSVVNPELTFAINGFPSFRAGWKKISLEANLRFLHESGAHDHLFFAASIDPFETKYVIKEIVKEIKKKHKKMNIVIAPLGAKTQALGALLYSLEDKKIKIIYPFPSFFQTDYSYKYGPTWIYKACLNEI